MDCACKVFLGSLSFFPHFAWCSGEHLTEHRVIVTPSAPVTIKPTPRCRGPPGCKWTLSCWLGSAWSPCPNCPASHWRQRVLWVLGIPRCSWCISCSSFSNTAMWWRTGGRPMTWAQWRCWHRDACRLHCRTACRLPSRRRRCSRRDR